MIRATDSGKRCHQQITGGNDTAASLGKGSVPAQALRAHSMRPRRSQVTMWALGTCLPSATR